MAKRAGSKTGKTAEIESGNVVRCAFDEAVDLALLVPHPLNPNKHTDEQIGYLAKIMAHQGWRHPVTVSARSGYIVAGHGRLMAAKLNGWTKAPIDKQEFATEADEYAHLVADNKIAELSSVDLAMVNLALPDLGPDFDLDLLGMPEFALDPSDLESEQNEEACEQSLKFIECPNCGEEFEAKQGKVRKP